MFKLALRKFSPFYAKLFCWNYAYAEFVKQVLLLNKGLLRSTKKHLSYFSAETYVVGTWTNCLNETGLLSTQNMF